MLVVVALLCSGLTLGSVAGSTLLPPSALAAPSSAVVNDGTAAANATTATSTAAVTNVTQTTVIYVTETTVTATGYPAVASCPAPSNNPTGTWPTQPSYGRKIVSAAGLIWEFYANGTDIVYRTSASGSTWSAPTVVIRGGLYGSLGPVQGYWFTVYQVPSDPAHIWFAYAVSATSDNSFEYSSGTLNSNGTMTWSGVPQSGFTAGVNPDVPSLTFDTKGDMWLAVKTTGAYPERQIEVFELSPGANSSDWKEVLVAGGFSPWPEPILTPLSDGGMVLSVMAENGTVSAYTTLNGGENWTSPVYAPGTYQDFSAVSAGDAVYYAAATTGGEVLVWNYTVSGGMGRATEVSPAGGAYCGATISTDGASTLAVGYTNLTAVMVTASTDLGGSWTRSAAVSEGDTGIDGLSLTSDYYLPGEMLMMWSYGPENGTYAIGTAAMPLSSKAVAVPRAAGSQAAQSGYVAYTVTTVSDGVVQTFSIEETVSQSSVKGESVLSLVLSTASTNLTYSHLVNSSLALFPYLPMVTNSTYSYKNDSDDITIHITKDGTASSGIRGTQYTLEIYSFYASISRAQMAPVTVDGNLTVLPSGLIYTFYLASNGTSAYLTLASTSLPLQASSGSMGTQAASAGVGVSAVVGTLALSLGVKSKRGKRQEGAKKPDYWVD